MATEVKSMEHTMDETFDVVEPQGTLLTNDDFLCGICYELMVLPTSLNCGHSFCRPCLSTWVVSSDGMKCPSCRQKFVGCPNINFVIRSAMEKSFGAEMNERLKEVKDNAVLQKKIEEFERKARAFHVSPAVENNSLEMFLRRFEGFAGDAWRIIRTVFLLALIVCNVFFIIGYVCSTDMDRILQKPIYKWSTFDVEIWLKDLGPWAETELMPVFRKFSIDGRLLLAWTENDSESMVNFSQPMYRMAFQMYLNSARDFSTVSPPADLWEYKTLHPVWACLLVLAVKNHPRSTFLIMYLLDYHNSFLPFIHTAVQGRKITHFNNYSMKLSEPSSGQLVDFVMESMFVPFVLIMKFTWNWLSIHWIIAPSIIVVCIEQTLLEAKSVFQAGLEFNRFSYYKCLKSYVTGLTYYVIPVVLWPVLPAFMYDVVFHLTLVWHVVKCLAFILMSASAANLALRPFFVRE